MSVSVCVYVTNRAQVHAFNVLKSIFHDTSLGAEVLGLADDGLILAVNGFSSPSWAVRNACTILFGTLVSRVFGCKRVKDDGSRLNATTASVFFGRSVAYIIHFIFTSPEFSLSLSLPLPLSFFILHQFLSSLPRSDIQIP